MGRKPKKVEFLTFSEIVDYAIDTYSILKLQTEGYNVKDGRKNVYNNILDAFIRHGLISKSDNKNNAGEEKQTDDQNNMGQKVTPMSKNNVSKKEFSLVVAKAVIEHDVCAYYQKSQTVFSSPTNHKFEVMDSQMREKYEQAIIDYETELKNEQDGLVRDTTVEKIPEKDVEYHIPIAGFFEYTPEFEDKVILNVMCHFLHENYDFHEEEYRNDLKKRSELLGTDEPLDIYDGYSEQTWKLEHPFGNYLFPKEKYKKKSD